MGVDIAYECVGPCTYRVHWKAYRDCGGAVNISPTLNFNVTSGTNCTAPLPLNNWSTQVTVEVTPICPGIQTQCTTPGALIRGVQEYYRFRDFDICSANCIYQLTWGDCCRNNAITSGSAGQQIFTGQTSINTNIVPCNSSPRFSNPPIPYICMGQGFTFNQGAYDPDGDSIAYSLGPCFQNNGNQIGYGPGYSPTTPLGNSWNLNLDPINGDLSIVPNPGNLVVGVLCIYVEEYRNGVLIGQVVRDMQVTVIDCGNNNLPQTSGVSNVVGGTGTGFNVSTCLGSNLCFDIPVTDQDVGQTVTAWWNQNIPGATFVQTGGTVQDTIQGTNPSATFCWTPTAIGVYTFLVTMEDDNCPLLGSNQYTFTITVSPPVSVAAQATPLCLNAQFLAQPTGGSAPFNYTWTGAGGLNASGPNPVHAYPGTGTYAYSVTVTDANGCTATYSGSVAIPQQVSLATTSTNLTCAGLADGTASATASNGTAPYVYAWSNNQSGNSLSNLAAGNYTVTVTDVNGCQDSATVTITSPPAILLSLSGTDPTCNSNTDGTATVTVAGGTPAYTYLWSNGQTTSTATGLSAGPVSVSVTDLNGCTATASLTLNAPTTIVLNISSANVTCNGGSNGSAAVAATGGSPAYSYSWSNGGTQAFTNNLAAGTYTVTVTDQNGCQAIATATVSEPAAIGLSVAVTSPTCFGASNGSAALSPTGGTPPFSYAWSDGQTTITATSLPAGPYSVTVTDANGCMDSLQVLVNDPPALSLSTNATPVSCAGGSDGSATAVASGGTPPYSWLWSNNATTSQANSLSAGTYTVVLTDANGCQSSGSVTVTAPPALTVSVSSTAPVCSGTSTGSAIATVSGGSPGYNYLWSNGQTTAQATGLSAGPVSVTVTDFNGCTQVSNIVLAAPSPLNLSMTASDIACAGGTDGSAMVTVNGGTPGYSYLWSDGQTVPLAVNLAAGSYAVTVTDTQGCSAVGQVSVGTPSPMTLALQSSGVNCAGEDNGAASVVVGGGTPAYSYSWSNGQTSPAASGLSAGWHSVLVTDANGCSARDSVLVAAPDILQVGLRGPESVCLGSSATLVAAVLGGTPGYSYSWTAQPGGSVAGGASLVVSPQVDTRYLLTVKDQNGCEVHTAHDLRVTPLPEADFAAENVAGCDSVTTVFRNRSQGAVAFLWDFGDGFTSSLENPTHTFYNGTYDVTLTVTSADGCQDSVRKLQLISVLPSPIADFNTREDIRQPILLSHAEINFINTSQFAQTFFWEFGDGFISTEQHPVHIYSEPGSYPVTLFAYNAYGCYDSIIVQPILVDPNGAIYVPNAFTPNGDGLNDEFLLKGEGIVDYQFSIYNRWGTEVFRSFNIQSSWDGMYQNQPAQEGVYVWKLVARVNSGAVFERGGSLTLIR